jgi:hypothetical protein
MSLDKNKIGEIHQEFIARLSYIHIQPVPKNILLFGAFSELEIQKISEIYAKAKIYREIDCEPLPSFEVILGAEITPEKVQFEKVFEKFAEKLAPHGMLLLTIPGPSVVENAPDMHDIGDLLLQLGFEDPVVDAEFDMTFAHAWGKKKPRQIQEKNPDGSLKSIRVSLDHLIASLKKPFQK